MNLNGAVAVVTGGASGIGKATRDLLAAEGARPVAWDLTGADVVCDVSSEESVEAAIRAELAKTPGIPEDKLDEAARLLEELAPLEQADPAKLARAYGYR